MSILHKLSTNKLETLLKRKIRKAVAMFDLIQPGDRIIVGLSGGPDSSAMFKLLTQMENDPKIEYYGSVGQEELAQHMATCGVWVYPTTFGEISCITAMKMQCAGAIPVTTNYAALHETVKYGHKMGEYMEPVFDKDEFLRTMISVVGNKQHQEAIRTAMVADARTCFRWDRVAKEWNAEYMQCSNNKLAKQEV